MKIGDKNYLRMQTKFVLPKWRFWNNSESSRNNVDLNTERQSAYSTEAESRQILLSQILCEANCTIGKAVAAKLFSFDSDSKQSVFRREANDRAGRWLRWKRDYTVIKIF